MEIVLIVAMALPLRDTGIKHTLTTELRPRPMGIKHITATEQLLRVMEIKPISVMGHRRPLMEIRPIFQTVGPAKNMETNSTATDD
jgi:hypothetical protein